MSLEIVLFQPENAGNLGNIIRTCFINNIKIHLIRPYGWIGNLRYFKSNNDFLKNHELVRSTMDCIDKVVFFEHDSWADFQAYLQKHEKEYQLLYFSKKNAIKLETVNSDLKKIKTLMVFGSETHGLTKLDFHLRDNDLNIFLSGINSQKSYNLSNAVAISIYTWLYT